MNNRGQAIIESIPFFMFLFGLMGILMVFTQWFLIHQKLLIGVREGAMLYSSGHHSREEVKRFVRAYLEQGSLSLEGSRLTIQIRRYPGAQAALFRLDEIKARYIPASRLLRFFQQTLEEKCIIKHAPSYGLPSLPLYGPPVAW